MGNKGTPGRRPGTSGAREAILAAARRAFADQGFTGATVRAIADDAAVDPALVRHYFGSKRGLFVQAAELPFSPRDILPRFFEGDPAQVGEKLVAFLIQLLEVEPLRATVLGLLRAAVDDPEAAELFRHRLSIEFFGAIVAAVTTDEPDLRASLVTSQMVGLAFARYVLRLEPLASLSAEEVIAAVGPAVQRYIMGPLARK